MAAAVDQYVRRVIVAVGIAAFAVLLVLAIGAASQMLLLVFGGVLLAVLLRGLADLLSEYSGIGETWSLWIVVVSLIAVFGVGGWYLWEEVAGQFDELGRNLTAIWDRIRSQLQKYAWGREILSMIGGGQVSAEQAGMIGRAFTAVLGGISGLVISIFIGLYVAADPTLYRRGFLRLVPLRFRDHAADILNELHETLRWWLLGTLVLMILVGTMTAVGLWLLGIPLALALGIIAFFLEFVPYIGPILAAVPAVLVASTLGPQEMLFVVLLYWGVQSIEGYLLSPLVYQKSVRIPPMITISSQVVLGTLIGVLGVIFATPLTACAIVLVQRLYVEDALGDRLERPMSQEAPERHEREGEYTT